MAELDFDRLRAEIEAATMLPEFDQVARRARRLRARGLLATASAVLVVLALLAPAGVLAARNRGTNTLLGPVSDPYLPAPGPVGPISASPSPSPVAPQATIVAADGADIDHVYALVDVCRRDSCDLQLTHLQVASPVTPAGPAKIGLLRSHPTDSLTGFRLEALSNNCLVVSAMPASGGRKYQRIDLGDSTNDPRPGSAEIGDRIGVVDTTGTLWATDARTNMLRSLPQQPPIGQLSVASVAPANGLWVTGTDPVTGDLAVSVSRDSGHHWTTTRLPVMAGADTPVLATYQGQVGYLLTRTVDRTFALFRTLDGGLSWQHLDTALPWPVQTDTGAGYGLIVRPDGSLLAWLATDPGPSYAQSTDRGLSFNNATGPGAPVIAVSNGYVSLGPAPRLSSDGSNWVSATAPTLPTS